jgi:hypothetical protein
VSRLKYGPWQRDAQTTKRTLPGKPPNLPHTTEKETIMSRNLTQRLVFAVALVAAAAGAQASVVSARDPYTDGARAVQGARDVYTEGARSVQDQRSPYYDGAHTVAGLDRTGVSAPPARSADPYLDGARSVQDQRSPYYDGARTLDPYYEGARVVAGMDRTGVSAEPSRSVDPYLDGAYA